MNKQLLAAVMAMGFVGGVVGSALAADSVNVGNKFCPISGEEVGKGEMGAQKETVEYKGKAYNLCCPMCKKDFLKNPEAAIKKMQEKEPNLAK